MRLNFIVFSLFTFAICIVLSIIYSHSLFDPVQTIQLFYSGIICIPVFALLFANRLNNSMFLGYFDLLFFAYLVFVTISIYNAHDFSISIFEICKLIIFYSIFKILQSALINKQLSDSLIGVAISIHVVFQCVLALYQIKTGIANINPDYRFLGTMTHSNVFSECILFSLPFVFIAIKQIRWPWKWIPFTALLLSFLLILIAETRAVWVGFMVGFFVVLFLLIKNKHISFRTSVIKKHFALFLVVTITLTLTVVLFFKTEIPQIYEHVISLKNFDSSGRNYLWKVTTELISNNFLIGVGPGNWRFHIPIINHLAQQRPHNDYLWVFSESGIFAFISFVTIFVYSIFKLVKQLKVAKNDQLPLLYALLFGIIVYCTDSFFAFPKERPYLLILLALLFALIHSTVPGKILFKVNQRMFALVAIPCLLFCSWFCWNRMQGEITNKKIIEYTYLSPTEKMNLLKSINPFFYAADPFSMPIKSIEAAIWVDLGNFENAKKYYLDAYKMAPLNPDICNNIGSISEMTSDRYTARIFYNKAIAIDSSNAQALLNLAVIDYKDGEKGNATDLVSKVDTNLITGQDNLLTQYKILHSSLRIK